MQVVEIYHYEPKYHFFLYSEAFEDQRPHIGLPAHSTDVRPPFGKVTDGMIPVFNGVEWDIMPDTFWRPKIKELNYDAGRQAKSYKPISLSIYGQIFPSYPSMPMLCNTHLVTQAICQRTRLIHEKFNLVVELHKQVQSTDFSGTPVDMPNHEAFATSPTALYRYKLEIETITYLMRRVLDSLVQLSYLLTNYADFESTKAIACNEIGPFLNPKTASTDLEKIIIGDGIDYSKDPTNFLRTINDLFNSFKHCFMHDESYHLICPETPTATSFQAKNNQHINEIFYHNHNAYHLMMGFQDNVMRILENQKIYNAKNSSL